MLHEKRKCTAYDWAQLDSNTCGDSTKENIHPHAVVSGQIVIDFAKGESGFRLFAAIVGDELVVASNPTKFTSPVSRGKPFYPDVLAIIPGPSMHLLL